jgi:predicted nucleic acid-binding protein
VTPRAVLDTNVIVSGIGWGGRPGDDDLLDLGYFEGIPIMAPAEFAATVSGGSSGEL